MRVFNVLSYMDPPQSQQVLLVLETEQLLYILHVAEIRASRLFWDHNVSQHELIVRLRARDIHNGQREERERWSCVRTRRDVSRSVCPSG